MYLSTPITTGEAFVTWRHTHGAHISLDNPSYESLHYEHVIATNITRVAPLVAELRKRYSDRLVIEPTPLEADGWTQRQYRDFWCALVEQYVAVVVLADGWQFSTGCVYEFATAMIVGKRVLNQSLQPIASQEGLNMIDGAIEEFEDLNVDSADLRDAHRAVVQSAMRR